MLDLFCGDMGSGKTLGMVKYISNAQKAGNYIIITNFYHSQSDLRLSTFEDLIEFLEVLVFIARKKSDKNSDTLLGKDRKLIIGIDEAGILFNARNFAKLPKVILDFLPQMRKMGIFLIASVQYPSMIDSNFRKFTSNYRRFYKRFGFIRLEKDYYLEPDSPDFYSADREEGKGRALSMAIWSPLIFSRKYFDKYNTHEIIFSEKNVFDPSPEKIFLANQLFQVFIERDEKFLLNIQYNRFQSFKRLFSSIDKYDDKTLYFLHSGAFPERSSNWKNPFPSSFDIIEKEYEIKKRKELFFRFFRMNKNKFSEKTKYGILKNVFSLDLTL